jgi:hypothetical protein
MSVTIETLKADPEVCKALRHGCDFTLDEAGGLDWFTIDGLSGYEIVGRDGTGGIFAVYGPRQHVLYVSSEGQAGVIAADLGELVNLLTAYPYWQTLLSVARNRTLGELRRAAPIVQRVFLDGDEPENEDCRAFARATLDIPPTGDAIKALHHAITVLGKDVFVRAAAGRICDPLLGPRPITQAVC